MLTDRTERAAQTLFGVGMMSVGALALVYGYRVLVFQPVPPAWTPVFVVIGYACGVLMLATGLGLLFPATASVSASVLLPFLLAWTLSRVPAVVMDPGREISWFAVGEIGVFACAGLLSFVRLTDVTGASRLSRATSRYAPLTARVLFGLSIVTYGLSHFFEFAARTVSLVPAWLPYRAGWADLTGAAQIVAGLGVLFALYPRFAAAMEAVMLSVFTLLVWVPAVIAKPALTSNWGEFTFTFALAGASWVVAAAMPTAGRAVERPGFTFRRASAQRALPTGGTDSPPRSEPRPRRPSRV